MCKRKETYRLNHSAGDGIMRTSGVYSQRTEPVDWRGRAWRGIDWVFGERHSCNFRNALLRARKVVEGKANCNSAEI